VAEEHDPAVAQALRSLEAARKSLGHDDDAAEDYILDVMDQLTGFCSPQMKLAGKEHND
jgi:hypothetical protein